MNFLLLAQRRLFAVVRAIAPRPRVSSLAQDAVQCPRAQRLQVVRPYAALPVRRAALAGLPTRPLRVLRVMEPGQQRTCVGRMVISGRMADVCAELDRLAAREASPS